MIPTIKQVMKCYRVIAQIERMKTGRPGVETAANALRGAVNVCRAAGIELTAPVTELTRKRIDAALAAFMQRGRFAAAMDPGICLPDLLFPLPTHKAELSRRRAGARRV